MHFCTFVSKIYMYPRSLMKKNGSVSHEDSKCYGMESTKNNFNFDHLI
ncbi:hypothetical protein T4E_8947 [Trichinella pseudospiralis]|uniref:Uncharacterized protein n=1 Tax=Trichinella pseudospiralis TaxID=6337 RepID=A0A0V0WEV9_TRIPS|nr:hypothetical protein T4E_8947 [Trichinella pseudospiralis]